MPNQNISGDISVKLMLLLGHITQTSLWNEKDGNAIVVTWRVGYKGYELTKYEN